MLRASDPYLCLRIDPVPIEHAEEWDLITNIPTNPPGVQTRETTMANNFSIQTNKIFNKVYSSILNSFEEEFIEFNSITVLDGENY